MISPSNEESHGKKVETEMESSVITWSIFGIYRAI